MTAGRSTGLAENVSQAAGYAGNCGAVFGEAGASHGRMEKW